MRFPATPRTAGRRRSARRFASARRHLSLYQLTIEPGTRFASMVAEREFEPLDPDARGSALRADRRDDRRRRACRPMKSATMRGPAQESRHNLTYWRYGDYAGIGPGAHGRRLGMRTVRHKKPENFLSALAPQRPRDCRGSGAVASRSRRRGPGHGPAPNARAMDADADRRALRPCVDRRLDAIDRLVASGHLSRDGGRIALTASGRLLLDHILGEIAAPATPTAGFGGCGLDAGVAAGVAAGFAAAA